MPRSSRLAARPSPASLLACTLTALALGAGVRAPCAAAQTGAGEERGTLVIDGVRRSYLLYRPPRSHGPARGRSARPLVVVLHGSGGTAAGMARHTGFDRLAKAEGFVVVYPQGAGRRWNDGRGLHTGYDDVAFIRALLDTVRQRLEIDEHRIYATGISNGAVFTYRLACDLPGTFAAIAPVAGGFPARLEATCLAARKAVPAPVAVFALQGTADRFMPYGGSADPARRGAVLSAERSVAFWAQVDSCATPPAETPIPDRAPSDGTWVEQVRYATCRGGRTVVLDRIRGGGHTWPGGPGAGEPRFGRVSREIDATTAIWRFFADTR